jgi:hypothetical protein
VTQYYITISVEAEDIQAAFGRVYPLIDKHGEGSPDRITEISITEGS